MLVYTGNFLVFHCISQIKTDKSVIDFIEGFRSPYLMVYIFFLPLLLTYSFNLGEISDSSLSQPCQMAFASLELGKRKVALVPIISRCTVQWY